ncbi:metalloregulator ArsR/SmtB family transcription factor [Cryobacterium sp. Y11]|uniref:helix-turn-helix transcriptional regulator n=1 Tax=Cryobacterium sp. Y11 TaxID=2045016 RepID=UPI000CE4C3B7|nr:helix-turn-helix domain-containing protein [Cryobacterium sp. Y11]
MDPQERSPAWHAALASPVRRRVLEFLVDSTVPLDATAVATHLNLHVTTARFHLDQLQSARLIEREPDRSGQRGRPRIRFSAVRAPRGDLNDQLSDALAGALAEDDDGGRARAIRAGEKWSAAFAGGLSASTGTGAEPLIELLDQLEFDPQPDATGQSIALTACPFREAARANPGVVCAVHLGLIQQVSRTLGHDDSTVQLLPFVGPNLCMVHLGADWGDPLPSGAPSVEPPIVSDPAAAPET